MCDGALGPANATPTDTVRGAARLEAPAVSQYTPGDVGKFACERDCQHVVVQTFL
jgi:hypothetical protein